MLALKRVARRFSLGNVRLFDDVVGADNTLCHGQRGEEGLTGNSVDTSLLPSPINEFNSSLAP